MRKPGTGSNPEEKPASEMIKHIILTMINTLKIKDADPRAKNANSLVYLANLHINKYG